MSETFDKAWGFVKEIKDDPHLMLTFGGGLGVAAYFSRTGVIGSGYFEYLALAAGLCLMIAISSMLKAAHQICGRIGHIILKALDNKIASRRAAASGIRALEKLALLQKTYDSDYQSLQSAFADGGYTRVFDFFQNADNAIFLAEMEQADLMSRKVLKATQDEFGVWITVELQDIVADLWLETFRNVIAKEKLEYEEFDRTAETRLAALSGELREQEYLLPRLLQLAKSPKNLVDGNEIDRSMHHYLKSLSDIGVVKVVMPQVVDQNDRVYLITIPTCLRRYGASRAGLTFNSA